MRDFLEYSPEDIIHSNLRQGIARLDMLIEQEASHLQDLADEIHSMGDLQEILASLPDRRFPFFEVGSEVLSENRPPINRLHGSLRAFHSFLLADKLCKLLTDEKDLSTDVMFSDSDPQMMEDATKIVYPKSSYADSAYLSLSGFLKNPQAHYAHSFIAACEEVYNGFFDCCILPLENSTEGILIGFVRLIARFDLKIAATCEIESHSDGRSTRFALLRRNVLPLHRNRESGRYFDLFLPHSFSTDSVELLSAADFFGLSPISMNTLPDEIREKSKILYFSFAVQNGNLNAFLIYLAMEFPQYIPIGIYPNLQKKGKT